MFKTSDTAQFLTRHSLIDRILETTIFFGLIITKMHCEFVHGGTCEDFLHAVKVKKICTPKRNWIFGL